MTFRPDWSIDQISHLIIANGVYMQGVSVYLGLHASSANAVTSRTFNERDSLKEGYQYRFGLDKSWSKILSPTWFKGSEDLSYIEICIFGTHNFPKLRFYISDLLSRSMIGYRSHSEQYPQSKSEYSKSNLSLVLIKLWHTYTLSNLT